MSFVVAELAYCYGCPLIALSFEDKRTGTLLAPNAGSFAQ